MSLVCLVSHLPLLFLYCPGVGITALVVGAAGVSVAALVHRLLGYQVPLLPWVLRLPQVSWVACVWWSIIHRAIVRVTPVSQRCSRLVPFLTWVPFLLQVSQVRLGLEVPLFPCVLLGVGCSSCLCVAGVSDDALAIGAMFASQCYRSGWCLW